MKNSVRLISLAILPSLIFWNHVSYSQDSTDTIYNCELNGTLTPEERRNISLFKVAKKIKVISFSQKVVRSTPLNENRIASKYVKDEITLTEEQIDQLTEILYNYNFSKNMSSKTISHGECYEPRHAIVFLNSQDKAFGYFEFCLKCDNHQTVPAREYLGEQCATKYKLIEKFFESIGVTFFEEES